MFKPIESAPKDGTGILGLWFQDGFPEFAALAWLEYVDDPDYSGWYSFADIAELDKVPHEHGPYVDILGPEEPQFWAPLDGALPTAPESVETLDSFDAAIERDAKAGKLDWLAKEAKEALERGEVEDL
jgi:hypothetical protein